MNGQLQFDVVSEMPRVKDPNGKAVRAKWYTGFQKWSDKMFEDENTPLGKCGLGEVCEYCVASSDNRACVKAFIEMLKAHRSLIPDYQRSVNYSELDYEDAWNGHIGDARLSPMNEG